jgi:hypothetical protein
VREIRLSSVNQSTLYCDHRASRNESMRDERPSPKPDSLYSIRAGTIDTLDRSKDTSPVFERSSTSLQALSAL